MSHESPDGPTHAQLRACLQGARALIKIGWTKGTWARDRAGRAVMEDDPEACCWCLSGALREAGGRINGLMSRTTVEALVRISREVGEPIAHWNDDHDRRVEEVLSVLDRAIASLPTTKVTA